MDHLSITIPTVAGEAIRRKRRAANLTLEDVVEKLEMSERGRECEWDKMKLSRYETGDNRMSAEQFFAICEVLALSPFDVVIRAIKDDYNKSTPKDGPRFEDTEAGKVAKALANFLKELEKARGSNKSNLFRRQKLATSSNHD